MSIPTRAWLFKVGRWQENLFPKSVASAGASISTAVEGNRSQRFQESRGGGRAGLQAPARNKLPALLSASEDGTAKAWQIAEEEKSSKLKGALVSTAFHPGYCYCAAWLRNPSKSTGISASAAAMQFSMSGDAGVCVSARPRVCMCVCVCQRERERARARITPLHAARCHVCKAFTTSARVSLHASGPRGPRREPPGLPPPSSSLLTPMSSHHASLPSSATDHLHHPLLSLITCTLPRSL